MYCLPGRTPVFITCTSVVVKGVFAGLLLLDFQQHFLVTHEFVNWKLKRQFWVL